MTTTMHDTPDLDRPVPFTLTPKAHAVLASPAANYVIPMCPGDDPAADWQEMGWDSHANAALAHVAWCPNHPGYWPNGSAVMWETFLQQLDPDEPVPLTLTPKARAALVDDPAPVEAFPPAVCLCGSTRFVEEFNRQRKALTEHGQIVLAIEVVTTQARENDPQHVDPALKARLDWLHKRKIDLADYVLVLNVGGYIGESTRSEIAYAHATGKPVRYLDPAAVDDDGWACEVCGFGWFGTRPDDGRCPDCRDAL